MDCVKKIKQLSKQCMQRKFLKIKMGKDVAWGLENEMWINKTHDQH